MGEKGASIVPSGCVMPARCPNLSNWSILGRFPLTLESYVVFCAFHCFDISSMVSAKACNLSLAVLFTYAENLVGDCADTEK